MFAEIKETGFGDQTKVRSHSAHMVEQYDRDGTHAQLAD
jgi:hypothetical protein